MTIFAYVLVFLTLFNAIGLLIYGGGSFCVKRRKDVSVSAVCNALKVKTRKEAVEILNYKAKLSALNIVIDLFMIAMILIFSLGILESILWWIALTFVISFVIVLKTEMKED